MVKISLKIITNIPQVASTFSVRAATIARMVASTDASQAATGGLLLLVLLLSVTTWLRPRQVSALRVTITAGTVLPF